MRPSASVAVTVKATGPSTVGVPLITPVAGARVRPAGSDPAVTAKVLVPPPPVVVSACVNGWPLVVGARAAGPTPSGSETVRVSACAPVLPSASAAVTVKGKAPVAVGVPLMTPVAELRVRPAGSVPLVTAKVYGPVPPPAVTGKL